MTVEELEILVTMKVTDLLREARKIFPAVKTQIQKAQEMMNSFSTEEFTKKIKRATTLTKKQLKELKNSNKDNEIKIKVNNKEASKKIDETKKSINSLKKQTTARSI